ncbi:STAS domain-containing protein [Streptomyces pimonensis]|uniref:STAS domain-containing protein n=1 Tax=Streptomyces pimonensis TaxID=2860288 RepID=UPI003526D834
MSLGEAVTGRSSGADGSRSQVLDQSAVVQYEWRGAWVVGARGSYDISSITPLADALGAAAKEHPRVVLDASGIAFADSTLLNLLILTHRAADLRVAAPPRQLQRLLQLTGVDTVLKVRATVEEAATC